MVARRRGLFSLYIYIGNFKNLFVRNHWTDSKIARQKCFLGDTLPRVVQAVMIRLKTLPLGCLAHFPFISIWKTLKLFWSKATGQISIYNGRNVPLARCPSTKIDQAVMNRKKNRAARGGAFFSYTKNLNIYLSGTTGPNSL